MKTHHTGMAIAALAGLALLGACGKGEEAGSSEPAAEAPPVVLENGMTPKEQIELRQGHLKEMGAAFKTIYEQVNASDPDLDAIHSAILTLPVESEGMETWFPEGTGPESGVDTDALPGIWDNKADFDEKLANFQAALPAFVALADSDDVAAIGAAFRETAGTCKSCHDTYRAED